MRWVSGVDRVAAAEPSDEPCCDLVVVVATPRHGRVADGLVRQIARDIRIA